MKSRKKSSLSSKTWIALWTVKIVILMTIILLDLNERKGMYVTGDIPVEDEGFKRLVM